VENRSQHSAAPPFGPTELRVFLALMQALAIGMTWHLWQVRTAEGDAPNLPLVDAAWIDRLQFGLGWPLLISLMVAIARPRVGIALHGGLLALAFALDQLRIQPEFISVAILLVGTLPGNGPKLFARSHLIALWSWAGLHKLLSAGYLFDSGPRMWTSTIGELPRELAIGLAITAAVFELALGILAIFPRTRRPVPWMAALLHLGILLSLVVQRWNPAVWPWNVAVIAAAVGLFAKEQTGNTGQKTEDQRRIAWTWSAASAIVLLQPGLYYVGLSDAYLSWCVYSSNTPAATLYAAGVSSRIDEAIQEGNRLSPAELAGVLEQAEGEDLAFKHYASINAPFAPAQRLYAQYLRRVGQPGEMLVIDDPRLIASWQGRRRVVLIMSADRKLVRW
jgi:hypothetical protein